VGLLRSRAGHSEAIHNGLLKMWLAMEIEDFPAWFEWQQGCFELIQSNLLAIGGCSARPAHACAGRRTA
jgi:hypothetical protein